MSRRFSWLKPLLIGVATWPLVGLVAVSIIDLRLFAEPGSAAHRQLIVLLQWMLLGPVVVQLVIHFPLRGWRARNVVIHALAAALLCLFRFTADPYPRWTSGGISHDVLMYVSIAMAAHLVFLVRQRMREERETAAQRRELARVERDLLTQRIAPELIIRTFDEIASRVRRDPESAQLLIDRFGEFLRGTAADDDRTRVALQRELENA